jgi:hypothetical protein
MVDESRGNATGAESPREATGVVVLGMSRSGTSALTRAFVRAGYYVGDGDRLAAPTPHNPVGSYERLDVRAADDELLRSLGGSWYAPPPRELQRRRAGDFRPILESLVDRIHEEAQGTPIAIKDPRIGVLLDVWLPVIVERLHPVLVIRNPLAVARSLRRRDALPVPVGLAMWEVHLRGLLDALAGLTVSVVHYEDVIRDPDQLRTLIAEAQPSLSRTSKATIRPDEGPSAISAHLRHHRADDADVQASLTGRQLMLHRYLSGLPGGRVALDPPKQLRETPDEVVAAVRDRDIWTPGLTARLEAIEKSTSWRVTRPVRWLGDLRLRLERRR